MNYIDSESEYWKEKGWYFSCGTHPQWKYDARIWRYDKWPNGKIRIITVIGQGACISSAINDMRTKFDSGNYSR